jgi:hypothetical protein
MVATVRQADMQTALQEGKRSPRLKKFCALPGDWNLRYSLPATSLFSCALPAFLDSPRVPPGTLEAGKIALRAKLVNSGVREKCRSVRRRDYASTAANLMEQSMFFVLPRRRAFLFLSQGNFFAAKK